MYRLSVFFGAAFFSLAIVLTTVHLLTASESAPRRVFFVLWIGMAAFGQYWYLFRQAYDLRFDSEYLYWRSPLRSGRLELQGLRRVRVRWGTDAFIENTDRARLHVIAQKGFTRFSAKLAAQDPGLEVRIGLIHRLLEWLPGSTLFRG